MIRPFTLVCALLAAGSGLYLYQTKHQAQLLDRQIRHVQDTTAALREHAGVLRADYALLNDPQRLADLAATHLPDLKPTQPAQWSTMAELHKRLPPVGAPNTPPAPLEPDSAPAAQTEPQPPAPSHAIMAAAQPVAVAAPSTPATTPPAVRPAAHPAVMAVARTPTPVAAAAPAPLAIQPVSLAAPARVPLAAPVPAQAPRVAGPARQQQLPATTVFAAAARAMPRSDAYTPRQATNASVPVVTSSLGMARAMVPAAAPANLAMPYTVGATR